MRCTCAARIVAGESAVARLRGSRAGRMLSARDLRHVNGDVPRDPVGNGVGLANRDDLGLQPRAEASPPVLLSHDEIGPARLVGCRPPDGFGLLAIATRGGLGEATRLPSILPSP